MAQPFGNTAVELIDNMIALARVLAPKLEQLDSATKEALCNLAGDDDMSNILITAYGLRAHSRRNNND